MVLGAGQQVGGMRSHHCHVILQAMRDFLCHERTRRAVVAPRARPLLGHKQAGIVRAHQAVGIDGHGVATGHVGPQLVARDGIQSHRYLKFVLQLFARPPEVVHRHGVGAVLRHAVHRCYVEVVPQVCHHASHRGHVALVAHETARGIVGRNAHVGQLAHQQVVDGQDELVLARTLESDVDILSHIVGQGEHTGLPEVVFRVDGEQFLKVVHIVRASRHQHLVALAELVVHRPCIPAHVGILAADVQLRGNHPVVHSIIVNATRETEGGHVARLVYLVGCPRAAYRRLIVVRFGDRVLVPIRQSEVRRYSAVEIRLQVHPAILCVGVQGHAHCYRKQNCLVVISHSTSFLLFTLIISNPVPAGHFGVPFCLIFSMKLGKDIVFLLTSKVLRKKKS